MTATFSADEILEIAGARLAEGMMPDGAASICCDTRILEEGQWFLALPGITFNGHDFLGEAFSRGAIGCIVEERTSYPIASTSFPLLAVENTEVALCELARSWRKRNQAKLCLLLKSGDQSEKLMDDLEKADGAFDASFLLESNVDWREIALALFNLTPLSKALVLEYRPHDFSKIDDVAKMTSPDVVLILAEAFSHLRLQEAPETMIEVEELLTENVLERLGTILLSSDSPARARILPEKKTVECAELSFAPELDFAPVSALSTEELAARQRSVILIDDEKLLVEKLMELLRVRQS